MTSPAPYAPPPHAPPPGGYRAPGAASGGGPPRRDRDREARLRGVVRYQRTATPQELEADLGTLRGFRALQASFEKVLMIAAGVAFLVFGGVAAVFLPTRTPAIAILPGLLAIVLPIVILAQAKRLSWVDPTKHVLASSLLRRLDVAPGTEVGLSVDAGWEGGRVVSDKTLSAGFLSGAATFLEVRQDDWLELRATLANGVSVRVTRMVLRASEQRVRSEGNRRVTSSKTKAEDHDRVEVRFDPALNPGLAAATREAIGARVRPPAGGRVAEVAVAPGAIAVGVVGAVRPPMPSADAVPLADLVAQVVHLVTPQRQAVMVDREAWPPNDEPERALLAAGVASQFEQLRGALPHAMTLGGVVLLVVALLGAVGTVSQVSAYLGYREDVEKKSGYLAAELAQLPTLSGASRDACELRIRGLRSSVKLYEEFASERIGMIATSAGIFVVSLVGGVALVIVGRRRAKAAAEKLAADRAAAPA